MTSKSCLNCTFLCHHENGSPVSWTKDNRDGKTSQWLAIGAKCFCRQWEKRHDASGMDAAISLMKITGIDDNSRFRRVEDANGKWLDLSSHSCELHHPFDAASSKPLETIKEEEDERRKEKKEDRKFWIKTVVAIIATIIATTIATIILAI